jgi:nucleoside 2-deoxyribosyltransferase
MPLTVEMTRLADQIYAREIDRIAQDTAIKIREMQQDIAARNLANSGIAFSNRAKVLEGSMRELCEARKESYSTVLREAGAILNDEDITLIVAAVTRVADNSARNSTNNLNAAIGQHHAPIPPNWAATRFENVRHSIAATTRRNLVIEKGLQQVRVGAANQRADTRVAFIIMSFRPELNDLYEHAILPAATAARLETYRVDNEEFDGTISDIVLDKIRTCRIVLADLTDERPNCYFELGYAMALGKPYILSARQDHDPRRPLRNPGDPKVHFDLDSHKVSFWEEAHLDALRLELEGRIRKVLAP